MKELILNINDDEAGRYTVSRVLKQEGYQVLEAASGWEGIALVRERRPELLILDIRLPDISGFEVCRILKSDPQTRTMPILHLTANALATDNKVQSLEEGAEAYLTFPLEPAYLVATVQSLIRLKRAEAERTLLLEREQEERRKLSDALAELETERTLKEQFVATLTHDLRSPLSAIRLGIQLLMRRGELEPGGLQQCGRILGNTDRIDRMIRDLLDMSQVKKGNRLPIRAEEFDLIAHLRDVLSDFVTHHGDRFEFKCGLNALSVTLDPAAVRRALENLLENAVKYGKRDRPITLAITEQGDEVEVAVHNHGDPIPADQQPLLFEPYRRAPTAERSQLPGWGLGLALVRAVADAQDGRVAVDSRAETGTTFKLILPQKISADLPSGLTRVGSPAPDLSQLKEKGE